MLAELLASIFCQLEADVRDRVEICISDNGSHDQTRQIVAYAQSIAPCALHYHRYEVNQGLLNFENVIAMARTEYCWMIGSDDLLPPGSIRTILQIISESGGIAGFTINKLNFNVDYSALIGPDNAIVLPSEWSHRRVIAGWHAVCMEMFFLLSFISAHVLKKSAWDAALEELGQQEFRRMRHFAFSAALATIIRKAGSWLWVPSFLVTQRLGNSSLVEDIGEVGYATQCTQDMLLFMNHLFGADPPARRVRASLLRKLFILYWNPIQLLTYKSGSKAKFRSDVKMLAYCTRTFAGLPLFWLTSFIVLLIPGVAARPFQFIADLMLSAVRRGQLGRAQASSAGGLDRAAADVLALARQLKQAPLWPATSAAQTAPESRR